MLVLYYKSRLNEYLPSDSPVDPSTFFAARGMDIKDSLLDKSDTVSPDRWYCASHVTHVPRFRDVLNHP